MSKLNKKDNKDEIKKIILSSGNSFHSKIVNLLRTEDWSVLVSPYYSDNFTDKPREIDILTEKLFDIQEHSTWYGTLTVRLFIECKYITGKTVFWFDKKDRERAILRIKKDSGLDGPESNTAIERHHYFLDNPVAKLFTSETRKSEENEPINKAINQNLNATIYYRNKNDLKIVKIPKGRVDKNLKVIPYPIIVVNSFDNFYRVSMDNEEEIEQITEPFQLEVNYAYKDNNVFIEDHRGDYRNEYFLIDVVSLEQLPNFLKSIEGSDIDVIKQQLAWNERYKEAQKNSRGNLGSNNYI